MPRSRLPELVLGVHKICSRWGLRVICYGHAGDGNIHCNLLKAGLSDDQWERELPDAIDEIFRLTVALGGTISGEHGIGHVQRRYLPSGPVPGRDRGPAAPQGCPGPHGIFNPGKALPD